MVKFWCLQLAPLCLSIAEIRDKDVDTKLLNCLTGPQSKQLAKLSYLNLENKSSGGITQT